jgi:hypothetical protein
MSKMRNTLVMGLGFAGALLAERLVAPWQQRWGATDEEVAASLPGDDLIEEPVSQVTRGISIDAPPHVVWSWLVQLGAERGGFYSYDWLEDLFGLGIHSATGIDPEWQTRSVGDVVYGDSRKRGGWYVMEVQPDRALVLQTGDLKHARPARRADGSFMEFSWAFVLNPTSDGTTRLLVRERVGFRNRSAGVLMTPVGLVSFVMTQKMMREMKRLAEMQVIDTAA